MMFELPVNVLEKLLRQSFVVIVVFWIVKICLMVQSYFEVLSHLSRQPDQADNAISDPQADVVVTGHFIITIHIHDMIRRIMVAGTFRMLMSVTGLND
jgi:hypothetical protein